MIEIPYKDLLFKEVEIIDLKNVSQLKNKHFKFKIEEKGCLKNSYNLSKEKDIKCIEGFVFLRLESTGNFLVHCWNKLNDKYIDITENAIWCKNGLEYQAKYFPVAEFDSVDYKISNYKPSELKLISNVEEIVKDLNEDIDIYYREKNK